MGNSSLMKQVIGNNVSQHDKDRGKLKVLGPVNIEKLIPVEKSLYYSV